MGTRRRLSSDGFSLLDLTDDIKNAAQSLVNALADQGVKANPDMIFTSLQSLVQQAAASAGAPGIMMASETPSKKTVQPPYNLSADYLAAGFQLYHNGGKEDRKEAIRHVVQAFELDDADDLMMGLVTMNASSKKGQELQAAADAENAEGAGDSEPDESDEDLTDEDIDSLVQEDADTSNDTSDNGGDEEGESSGDESGEDEGDGSSEDEGDVDDTLAPMSDKAPPKMLSAADRYKQVMGIKASADGSEIARRRAVKIIGR